MSLIDKDNTPATFLIYLITTYFIPAVRGIVPSQYTVHYTSRFLYNEYIFFWPEMLGWPLAFLSELRLYNYVAGISWNWISNTCELFWNINYCKRTYFGQRCSAAALPENTDITQILLRIFFQGKYIDFFANTDFFLGKYMDLFSETWVFSLSRLS